MLLYDLRDSAFVEAEVPGTGRVDDDVGTVLAKAEAVHTIYADVAVHPRLAELALERLTDLFGAAFLATPTLADQYVGVIVAYLGLWQRRDVSVRFDPGLLLLLFLGNVGLRLLRLIVNNRNISSARPGRYDVS